jgi:hypothetical protein
MRVRWCEEEIKLLLSYYRQMQSGDMHKKHPLVIEASERLRKLPFNAEFSDKSDKFRNPNGVALKLANFLFIDPRYKGKGMKGCSGLDKKVFNEEFLINRTMHYKSDIYPFKFINWFSSNNGAVRRPMDTNSGRPLGQEVIKNRVHTLIDEMVDSFAQSQDKYICILIGGPGNGKTDIMEYASERFVTSLGGDWSCLSVDLKKGFDFNNRQSSIQLKSGIELILTQDASQKDKNSKDFSEAIFNDLERFKSMSSGLFIICMNRGILEEVYRQSRNTDYLLSQHSELINKIYQSNSLNACIEDMNIWGDRITKLNCVLYTWSMDLDTLFQKHGDLTIKNNLIKDIFDKANCLNNYIQIANPLNPILAAFNFIDNSEKNLTLARIFRSYEIINSKRFTFREIFNQIAYLFYYSESQLSSIENLLLDYDLNKSDVILRFCNLFDLYKETYAYRFFDGFLTPKDALYKKCVEAFKDNPKRRGVDALFRTLRATNNRSYEKPEFVNSTSFFDPIGCSDDISFVDVNGTEYSFDQLRKKVNYNNDFDIADFSNFLNPIEIEIINNLFEIKNQFCLSVNNDDINHRMLNALDTFKNFLNVLILAFIKRSLFFSFNYMKDREHIDSYLELIEGDYSDRIQFSRNVFIENLIDSDRKVEISLVTSIGQTPSQFTKNVFFKGFYKNIDTIPDSKNNLPYLDHIILLCHHNLPIPHRNNIIITYKLFREIQRASLELLKGCYDKNFTLWRELKKSEILDADVKTNEIVISDIGKIRFDNKKNAFTISH